MRAANGQTSLINEALSAVRGTWLLLTGSAEAGYKFDLSQRGLAGSFIPLLLANVLLAGFLGLGSAAGSPAPSPAAQLFIVGALIALRYGAMRLVLPRLSALHAFRPMMVVSNWTMAICLLVILGGTFAFAFVAALLLGPSSGETLVALVLALWATVAIAALVIEINIYRLIVGLRAMEIGLAIAAQILALLAGIYLLSRLPLA